MTSCPCFQSAGVKPPAKELPRTWRIQQVHRRKRHGSQGGNRPQNLLSIASSRKSCEPGSPLRIRFQITRQDVPSQYYGDLNRDEKVVGNLRVDLCECRFSSLMSLVFIARPLQGVSIGGQND